MQDQDARPRCKTKKTKKTKTEKTKSERTKTEKTKTEKTRTETRTKTKTNRAECHKVGESSGRAAVENSCMNDSSAHLRAMR
ncbi:hypothetical protein G7Z17_g9961 [Cylindrodendrum hubeiense]|uniref:Uncharacterized protein n=1 Tax=Cylindrodendrum hubeiense TaxID=595255 RepID=A0A9P5H0G1_9HYPO|nr:hypothetical protein G7Z17_g9961 [Cylindrodendrum hubeiense]